MNTYNPNSHVCGQEHKLQTYEAAEEGKICAKDEAPEAGARDSTQSTKHSKGWDALCSDWMTGTSQEIAHHAPSECQAGSC